MRNRLIFCFVAFMAATGLYSQPNAVDFLNSVPLSGNAFSNCAAIFYRGEMLVDEYSPKGTCKIIKGNKGKLTLASVELNDQGGRAIKNLPFKIAIQDHQTNTILLYSDEEFEEIMIEDVLDQCKKGDKILIITLDPSYALSHNEIEVLDGC